MTHPTEEPSAEDVQRVASEVANRLEMLGIWLSGEEEPEELARILEAVERFELAVESRGGDLMVDEGPDGRTTQPDDPHFALPVRRADESVDRYVDQLERATGDVLLQPPRQ